MTNAQMAFDDYVWPVNPSKIIWEGEKQIASFLEPYAKAGLAETGLRPCRIRGEGVFFGADASRQFERLQAKFLEQKAGWLSVPGFAPLPARFSALAMTQPPAPEQIQYAFAFLEEPALHCGAGGRVEKIHICRKGETLWHLSRRYGIPVETLADLNPELYSLFELEAYQEVRLC